MQQHRYPLRSQYTYKSSMHNSVFFCFRCFYQCFRSDVRLHLLQLLANAQSDEEKTMLCFNNAVLHESRAVHWKEIMQTWYTNDNSMKMIHAPLTTSIVSKVMSIAHCWMMRIIFI